MQHPGHRHHNDHGSVWDNAPPWAAELGRGVFIIIERLTQMTVVTDKLLADVTAQTTVLNSLVLFVQGINTTNADQAQQIVDLKAALAAAQVNDPAVQAVVDAMDATVQANTALAQGVLPAVTANTPTPPAQAAQAAAAASQ